MPEEPTTPDPQERMRVLLDLGDRGDWDAAIELFAPDAIWVAFDELATFEDVDQAGAAAERLAQERG
jgi:hypothetical protein